MPGFDAEQKSEVKPWFALQVRSRHEEVVAGALAGKAIESYLPVYKTRRRWSDRTKELDLPLFPGYVFARVDLERRLPVLTTPGVVRIVGFGGVALPIEEAEIAAVRQASTSGAACEPCKPEPGDRVRLKNGPMSGVEGVMADVQGRLKLILSVGLLGRSIAVSVEDGWDIQILERKNDSRPAVVN